MKLQDQWWFWWWYRRNAKIANFGLIALYIPATNIINRSNCTKIRWYCCNNLWWRQCSTCIKIWYWCCNWYSIRYRSSKRSCRYSIKRKACEYYLRCWRSRDWIRKLKKNTCHTMSSNSAETWPFLIQLLSWSCTITKCCSYKEDLNLIDDWKKELEN